MAGNSKRSEIPPEVLRFAEAQVAQGHYPSLEAVLVASAAALRERMSHETRAPKHARVAQPPRDGDADEELPADEAEVDACWQ